MNFPYYVADAIINFNTIFVLWWMQIEHRFDISKILVSQYSCQDLKPGSVEGVMDSCSCNEGLMGWAFGKYYKIINSLKKRDIELSLYIECMHKYSLRWVRNPHVLRGILIFFIGKTHMPNRFWTHNLTLPLELVMRRVVS